MHDNKCTRVFLWLFVTFLILHMQGDGFSELSWVASNSNNHDLYSKVHKNCSEQQTTVLSMRSSCGPFPYPVRIAIMGGRNFGIAPATACARNCFALLSTVSSLLLIVLLTTPSPFSTLSDCCVVILYLVHVLSSETLTLLKVWAQVMKVEENERENIVIYCLLHFS